MGSTALPFASSAISVKVQPLALLNICDAFVRRNEGQARVIGTLLGTVIDNVVEVKNCYAVPHKDDSDQVRSTGSVYDEEKGVYCMSYMMTSA